MDKNRLTISVAGKEIVLETGKVARQANGSVMLRSKDTILLATACAHKEPTADIDFFPLRVDYQEKFSAAGKTLGGFIKREGKPSEKETLTSRLIDRPIRPLFPEGYFNEVQILAYVLSFDSEAPPEPLAICAASAALVISDIPFLKPIGSVRVGRINEEFVINPSLEEMKSSSLDLVLAGTEDAILMIEGYCDFLSEETVIAAIEEGHKHIITICKALSDWQNLIGKEKAKTTLIEPSQELVENIDKMIRFRLQEAYSTALKGEREILISDLEKEVFNHFASKESSPLYPTLHVKLALKSVSSKVLRDQIFDTKKRCDGRGLTDIRPISIDMTLLPRTHGSCLFTRGETQTIAVCTLGGSSMAQKFEDLKGEGANKFYLQYNFPPFSVGEVGRMGSPGRREIGHGKLAERAILSALPKEETFPYTIRLESNITESNGSSSMASVCGGCLALMDAGVPLKRPVSGIAMGLLLEKNNFIILSDILGIEDALGDMDFKVTGDASGITAFQMDIKIEGITTKIMQIALQQAKMGRIHILNKMLEACPKSKENLSPYAPRIETMIVKTSKIAIIIGPGGKTIRSIIEETGAQIDINDDGIVNIASTNQESLIKAKEMIYNLVAEIEEGKVYRGPVVSIQPFGAFVRLPGSKDGLCHISELAHGHVRQVQDIVKEGDIIDVKVLGINDRGQIKLSRKVLLQRPSETLTSH